MGPEEATAVAPGAILQERMTTHQKMGSTFYLFLLLDDGTAGAAQRGTIIPAAAALDVVFLTDVSAPKALHPVSPPVSTGHIQSKKKRRRTPLGGGGGKKALHPAEATDSMQHTEDSAVGIAAAIAIQAAIMPHAVGCPAEDDAWAP